MFLFSCKKASRLMSDSFERSLTLPERFSLRIHLSICSMCRRARKQFYFINSIGHHTCNIGKTNPTETKLSPDAKQRIQQEINNKLNH